MDKGFFKGLIFGMLAGGVIALLFAPKSGKETREALKQKMHMLKHKMAWKLAHLKNMSREKYNQAVDEAVTAFSEAKNLGEEETQELTQKLKENYEKIKKALEEE